MGRVSFLFIVFFILTLGATSSGAQMPTSLCGVLTAWSGDPLFRELVPEQLNLISQLPGEAEFAQPLSQALAQGSWSHPVLDPKHPDGERVMRAALGLYLKKNISVFQLATLLLRSQTQKDFGAFATSEMETLSLAVENGQLNQSAILLLQNGDRKDHWTGAFNDAQLATFARDELPLFAPSERSFFLLRVKEDFFTDASSPSVLNLSKILSFISDTRIFIRRFKDWPGVLREGEVGILVPSLSLLQARLRVLHGQSHMQLQPLLGKSTTKSVVEHSERGLRVFALGFPTLPDPELADEFTTHWTGFTWHDYFHAAEGSKINPLYRTILLRVARIAHEKWPRHAEAERLWRKAVDLDSNGWEGLDWVTRFQRDLGAPNSLGNYILRTDLARNPLWYRERGIDPKIIAQLLPPVPWLSWTGLWRANP